MPLSARCNIPMMCVGRGSTPPYEGIARIAAHYQAGRCGHCPLRKSCRAWLVCPAVGLRRSIGGGTHGCRPAESYNLLCRGGVLPRPPLRCKLQKQAGQSRRPCKRSQAAHNAPNPKKYCHCEPARRLVWQSVILCPPVFGFGSVSGRAASCCLFRKKGVRSLTLRTPYFLWIL